MDGPHHGSDEAKILVIYTGGTIGMMLGPSGYRPEPYFLTESLRSQARFHDPFGDSLFSHAGSSQGFRDWSSGSSPTSGTPRLQNAKLTTGNTLVVRSSRPIGTPISEEGTSEPISTEKSNSPPQPTCRQIDIDVYEAELPSLVTPKSSVHGAAGKRIRYAILEWNPLLDSSNIEDEDWIRIATEIELNYSTFDAFVVLHGTDTMAYTSSALSFLLEDLGKTVIITGAQIPLSQLRNDAVDNLLGALVIAGHYIIPECCLYFNHVLYRGNRVSKSSSYDFNAFSSPNFSPLVNVGIDIVVNWDDVIRPTSLKRFRAHKQLSPHVATLRLFPGITATTVKAFLAAPTQGVVLETFGAGNAPQRPELMQVIKEACDRGVVVVAISQCAKGTVSDAYETGRTLLDTGVVAGGDMTPECALAKLSYLLSKTSLEPKQVRSLIGEPIRGELTRRTLPQNSSSGLGKNASTTNIHNLLTQIVRLSAEAGFISSSSGVTAQMSPSLESVAPEYPVDDSAAPWAATANEAAATEAALYPFLIHAAVARDDIEGLTLCVEAGSAGAPISGGRVVPGGIVNCLDAASGRSPLHTAALHGSVRCTSMLLRAGALVHVRDLLGHTALYYAARQQHEPIVDLLAASGANLGGTDVVGGFAPLAAHATSDTSAQRIWSKCGVQTGSA